MLLEGKATAAPNRSRARLPNVAVVWAVIAALTSGTAYWLWTEPADVMLKRPIVRVAISKSGRWVAAASASGWIGIWERIHPEEGQRFRVEGGQVQGLAFSPDEHLIAIANQNLAVHPVDTLGSVRVIRTDLRGSEIISFDAFGMPVTSYPPGSATLSAAPADAQATSNVLDGPGPHSVLFGNYAGSVEIWNRETGEVLQRFTLR